MTEPTRELTRWPSVAALRVQFAEQAVRAAMVRQAEEKWTTEETVARVRSVAVEAADDVGKAVLEAAEMALDVWAATR